MFSRKKFVILSYPRTGSTFFVKTLDGCSGITCHSEIFHNRLDVLPRAFHSQHPTEVARQRKFAGLPLGHRSEEEVIDYLFRLKQRNFQKYLDIIFSERVDVVGFKIFYGQHNQALAYLIDRKEYKKIILWRENTLKSYVSLQKALRTDVWDKPEPGLSNDSQIEINYEDFRSYHAAVLYRISEYQKRLKATDQNFLIYSYEQFVSRFPADELASFLELEELDLDLRMGSQKQNPDEVRSMISNYHEVERNLVKDKMLHLLL